MPHNCRCICTDTKYDEYIFGCCYKADAVVYWKRSIEILATQKQLPRPAEAQEREKHRVGILALSHAECTYSDNAIQFAAAGNDLQLNLFRILFHIIAFIPRI
jgi:hypothetical protein